ncbi:MAG: Glu/Leu/Phe/Val dehydrogenase [Bacteroidia bacterium]|nr:Glu/Leu/Phe/Val dehydrogenase [Bacteroidia bacterium]MCZ2140188.1 leucine dehydrogenase [Bacteroidia bacterium]
MSTTQAASNSNFDIFSQLEAHNHEQVVFCQDKDTGLKAIIAIHNTVLGPGLGGTRVWHYNNDYEAFNDVMRLSRGMTYKAAISGLNLGGAKAVIIGDAKTIKTEALMRKFGRFVENLNGKYITAEDVNTTTRDMEYVHMETSHVVGLPESMGGGGDPSPVTAYGVYMGMKAAAKHAFGNESLQGKKVAVQGLGKVGGHLVEHLHKEGAQLFVTDLNQDAMKKYNKEFGATVVSGDEIFGLDVDIFAPCALGAVLNTENINKLKAKVIAGAANNQLADEEVHGKMLIEKGIAYAPDFLINAGGLINVYQEYIGYNKETAMRNTEHIYDVTLEIFKQAAAKNIHTQKAAIEMAEKRINDILKVRSTY